MARYSPQSYTYDAWGRLKLASTAGLEQSGAWRLQWDYDRFGNRRNQTLTGGNASVTQPQLNISKTTNRITDAGFAYDAAGNLTNDAIHSYSYDAENRIKTLDSTAATYTYDPGPLRIKKVTGGSTTVYIFPGSKVIAEYVNGALSKEYVYAGSQLLTTVAADGNRTYHHPDHLSIRTDTDATGDLTRAYGHFPFGETWYEEAPQGQTLVPGKWKFTSYERDSESDLDYAIFRGYNSRLGRFVQADLLGGSTSDPQSMNRYSYVENDPINTIDPMGLSGTCTSHCIIIGYDEHGKPIKQCSPPVCHDDPSDGPDSTEGTCYTTRINGLCQDKFAVALIQDTPDMLVGLPEWLKKVKVKLCSGGGFAYLGLAGKLGGAKAESLALLSWDSKEGGSHGSIWALGYGPLVLGLESTRAWRGWKEDTSFIGFLGQDKPTTGTGPFNLATKDFGGFAQYKNGHLSLGLYGGGTKQSLRTAGAGAYLTLSSGKCD